MQQVSAINWDALRVAFVVLTWGKRAPKDGKEAHSCVEALWKAWERRYGKRPSGVWKKEFQRRGVIHYSMWLEIPENASFATLRKWTHETWYRLAGHGDVAHLYVGTHCSEYEGSPLTYLLKECFGAGKEYQNIPPVGFHTGRWWGFIGGLRPIWDEQELSFEQGVKVRRLMRGYLRAKGYRGRVRSSIHGVWASMLPATRAKILETLR
jgi:hypothetical protein